MFIYIPSFAILLLIWVVCAFKVAKGWILMFNGTSIVLHAQHVPLMWRRINLEVAISQPAHLPTAQQQMVLSIQQSSDKHKQYTRKTVTRAGSTRRLAVICSLYCSLRSKILKTHCARLDYRDAKCFCFSWSIMMLNHDLSWHCILSMNEIWDFTMLCNNLVTQRNQYCPFFLLLCFFKVVLDQLIEGST